MIRGYVNKKSTLNNSIYIFFSLSRKIAQTKKTKKTKQKYQKIDSQKYTMYNTFSWCIQLDRDRKILAQVLKARAEVYSVKR